MKTLARAALSALLLLIFTVATLQAQERNLTLDGVLATSRGEGYKPLRLGVEATLKEKIAKRLGFSASLYIDRAQKNPGGGYQFGTLSTLRFYGDGYFVGAGVRVSHQLTSFYSKTSTAPTIEVGLVKSPIEFRFLVEPIELTSPNKGKALGAQLDYYKPSDKSYSLHLFVRGYVAHFRCNQTAQGLIDGCTGASVRAGIGLVFWRRKD